MKNIFIQDTSRVITNFLNKQYYPSHWCIAGGFVRDYLCSVVPRDVDIYIKVPYVSRDLDVLNGAGLGKWQERLVYTKEEYPSKKHITTILTSAHVDIELIYIRWGGDFKDYISECFDVSISKTLWSPETGLYISDLAFQDMKDGILRFSPGTSVYYKKKLVKKFPKFMVVSY
jgi:hypothetical protein